MTYLKRVGIFLGLILISLFIAYFIYSCSWYNDSLDISLNDLIGKKYANENSSLYIAPDYLKFNNKNYLYEFSDSIIVFDSNRYLHVVKTNLIFDIDNKVYLYESI